MRAVFTVLAVGLVAAFLVPGLGTASSSVPRLEVVVEGNGRVTSNDQKIDCPGTCSAEYPNQGTVELTTTPSTGETFTGWSEDCQGTSKCAVTMDQDRKVKASFSGASPEPSVTATATAEPTTTASPAPTASASPAPTATVSPQPTPTTTPAPSQSAATVAAHLVSRGKRVRRVAPRPKSFSIVAARRFTCERRCLVSAVLRDRAGKRRTLARGSATTRGGDSPGVKLRFTKTGRSLLRSGGRSARLTISVQMDEVARRSRNLILRVSD